MFARHRLRPAHRHRDARFGITPAKLGIVYPERCAGAGHAPARPGGDQAAAVHRRPDRCRRRPARRPGRRGRRCAERRGAACYVDRRARCPLVVDPGGDEVDGAEIAGARPGSATTCSDTGATLPPGRPTAQKASPRSSRSDQPQLHVVRARWRLGRRAASTLVAVAGVGARGAGHRFLRAAAGRARSVGRRGATSATILRRPTCAPGAEAVDHLQRLRHCALGRCSVCRWPGCWLGVGSSAGRWCVRCARCRWCCRRSSAASPCCSRSGAAGWSVNGSTAGSTFACRSRRPVS